MWSRILVLFLLVFGTDSKITQERVEFGSDSKYANVTAAVWQQDDHSYASWTTETFVDLDNLLIYMNFSVPLSDQDTGYGNDTVQTMVDLCKLLEHGDNFLVELLLDEIETKADIKLSCPFVKQVHNMLNFEMNEKHFPVYLLMGTKFAFTLRAVGMLADNKSFVTLYTIKIFGEIKS